MYECIGRSISVMRERHKSLSMSFLALGVSLNHFYSFSNISRAKIFLINIKIIFKRGKKRESEEGGRRNSEAKKNQHLSCSHDKVYWSEQSQETEERGRGRDRKETSRRYKCNEAPFRLQKLSIHILPPSWIIGLPSFPLLLKTSLLFPKEFFLKT